MGRRSVRGLGGMGGLWGGVWRRVFAAARRWWCEGRDLARGKLA